MLHHFYDFCSFFFFLASTYHHSLHSFPTRRSSDLLAFAAIVARGHSSTCANTICPWTDCTCRSSGPDSQFRLCTDRKSTRLNSSHTVISYAVFCLKKKNFPKYKRVRAATSEFTDFS